MELSTDLATGAVRLHESALRVRLLGAAIAAAAGVGLLVMPPEPSGRIAAGVAIAIGIGIALFATSRTVVCEPRAGQLRVTSRGITGESSERIPTARIVRIRLEHEDSVGREPNGGSFRLAAVLTNGKFVALSSCTSWQRNDKLAAGRALAAALGVAFED